MTLFEQSAPVNTCYLVKCGTCGKTTWKVGVDIILHDASMHLLAVNKYYTRAKRSA
ncbi:hypothetical protein BKA93DRAFT_900763 [Sparassis latifolia]